MSIPFWASAVVSAVLLSASTTAPTWQVAPMVLLVAGLLCSPLATTMSDVADRLSRGQAVGPLMATRVLPFALATMLLAMVYAVSLDARPQCWEYPLSTLLVAGVAGGVLNASGLLPARLGAQALYGLIVMPLVCVGLWMGRALRRHPYEEIDDEDEEQRPVRHVMRFFLGILLATFVTYVIHRAQPAEAPAFAPLVVAPLPSPARGGRPMSPSSPFVEEMRPLSPQQSQASSYRPNYTTLDQLQSLLNG